jgi:hypothetical protein
MTHPLKGYYLTRVYHEGADPFQVISDLSMEAAAEMCAKVAPHRRVAGKKGDHHAYMQGRLETEDWLRENASAVGVRIDKQNPVYFTLTREPQEDKAPAGRKVISIPAEQIDLSCCSFTYGDSMNRTSSSPQGFQPHPLEGTVLNAVQAAAAITSIGIKGDYLNGGRYFEVQMWANPPMVIKQKALAVKAKITPAHSGRKQQNP